MAMLSILNLYNYDPTIFEGLEVPEGIDRATLISTILLQNAELSLIYTEPETMKSAISLWSTASQYAWTGLIESTTFEYNPIWNKDGTITETETIDRSASGTDENKVSAYNESTYQNRSKDETAAEEESSRSYERTEQGNIGVTSTQSLIKEQREIVDFNVYDRISEDFRCRFCVMVY